MGWGTMMLECPKKEYFDSSLKKRQFEVTKRVATEELEIYITLFHSLEFLGVLIRKKFSCLFSVAP
ncbi:hypothetical protein ACTXT7_012553 [Hymenolepis weldensis]